MTSSSSTPAQLDGPGAVDYPLMADLADPMDLLTVAELDTCSQTIRADVMAAVQPGHPRRALAIAVSAWALARRQDPKVPLAAFRALTFNQLALLLWPAAPEPDQLDVEDDELDQADELDQDQLAVAGYPAEGASWLAADDTTPGDDDALAAQHAAQLDPMTQAAADRPTAPTPGS